MVLSKDGLHFRYQRIDISYRFNFGYDWFHNNKAIKNNKIKIHQQLWVIAEFGMFYYLIGWLYGSSC